MVWQKLVEIPELQKDRVIVHAKRRSGGHDGGVMSIYCTCDRVNKTSDEEEVVKTLLAGVFMACGQALHSGNV